MSLPFSTTAPMGIVRGESELTYRSTGCLGSTMLKDYLGSPEGFQARYIAKRCEYLFQSTKSTNTGTALHLLSQGEDAYRCRYTVAPPEHLTASGILSSSAKAKEWIAAQQGEVITPNDDAWIRFLHERLNSNPVAIRLMTGTERELTGRVIDPYTGLPVQVRWDAFSPDWIVDLKTTSAPISKFKWAVRDFRYDVQAALYTSVHAALTGKSVPFFWAVVSTAYPFECRVIEAPTELMANGMADVDRALAGIAACDWGMPQTEPMLLEA